ncbi:hypothetical protein SISSUDRAFT_1047405 [Sistotremastrum suecicum HHB10207 ss-3]|uniref:Arrestin-like N-terminal domain-containing protein n=1 Tax=Sistotremastrum suecicum HHB10207 ss-3 TaxID=1314776 RepID=A0A166D657_9AGAM|nr:hypothetical protein SISSUDRAFT_1047405 [Sistotremastrum suecicum HHB10207 ss-3]
MGNPELEKDIAVPADSNGAPPEETLPAYEAHPSPAHAVRLTEHIFDVRDEKTGQPWAILKVKSFAGSSKSLPIFRVGDTITGSVELDLHESTSVHEISVKIVGGIINPQNRVFRNSENSFSSDPPFLELSTVLWTPKHGDPHNPSSTEKHTHLKGQYTFPFELKLPLTVDVKTDHDKTETFALPPHFTPHLSDISLNYFLSGEISSGLLHSHAVIGKNVGVLPIEQPSPPSPLRELAYSEGKEPPGPDADPEGWHTLAPVKIAGQLYHNEVVEITAVLSLAKPLVYTRGTFIPLHLHLSSPSKQALDLVATPESIQVCLARFVNGGRDALKKTDTAMGPQTLANCEAMAILWHHGSRGTAESSENENERVFSGEIKLKGDTPASCVFPHLVVRHHVVVLPFKATGFEPSAKKILTTEKVDIVARLPNGPRPVSSAPQGAVEPPLTDYKEWGNLSNFWVFTAF